ncbi:MAG: pyridoxamine 5'-phosphate oxidase family protein [Chloroflexota bacterium]
MTHPVRRADREITDRAEIEAVLTGATVLRLGLWDGVEPYVVPMSYGYDGACLYLHSAHEGRKIEILRQFPRVCFEVEGEGQAVTAERACAWGVRYASVIGWGTVTFVSDPDDKAAGLNVIMRQHGGAPADFGPEQLAGVTIIRIDIECLTAKARR